MRLSDDLSNETTLLEVAMALAGEAPFSPAEHRAMAGLETSPNTPLVAAVRGEIQSGADPLGDAYCRMYQPERRRSRGQTFTPPFVVDAMLAWVKRQNKQIVRLVDPGAGSGRYTTAALQSFPAARAIAIETDPAVAILLRANLEATGLRNRTEVVVSDFRALTLSRIDGATLFLGNPPYVRHHDIDSEWKAWYSKTLKRFGHEGSQLAGLHLHFFLKTLELSSRGDLACYVTAAEWLDVNYGQALRELLIDGLGGTDIFVAEPAARVFDDALVSAAITCFSPWMTQSKLRFKKLSSKTELQELCSGKTVEAAVASTEPRWSVFVRDGPSVRPAGFIELGELFKISRGQVTGLNRVWIAGAHTPQLPSCVLVPAITDARDITRSDLHVIGDLNRLRKVVSLPRDLSALSDADKAAVNRFLEWAKGLGAHETYIARHRKPWWTVSFKEAAPIVMTYMGRRPPVFALNPVGAQLINVAHGLYPRQPLGEPHFRRLVDWLNSNVSQSLGRVYAGGLTKFEPSEAMRILIPEVIPAW